MLDQLTIRRIVEATLSEDLHSGDLTSACTVSEETQAVAVAIAKAPLVCCGGQVFEATFKTLDPELRVIQHVAEGTPVSHGTKLWTVSGSARNILMAERSALNLVQRMAGTATLTAQFVKQIPSGSPTKIADTRKTTPGLRALERHAVRVGGGRNHRDNLGSAVMIKDNHIAAAGGIEEAVRLAKQHAPHTTKIEIEVETQEMLQRALSAGADIIMLDNFSPTEIEAAVAACRNRAIVEVSGGISLERVAELAAQQVDVISVGALTHSAPAADISLRIQTE